MLAGGTLTALPTLLPFSLLPSRFWALRATPWSTCSVDVVGDMVAGAASHYCFDHTPFGGIVIPTLRRAVSRTPKGAVLSGPTGVLLQMSDIKLIPNAPKEKNNDR